MKKLLLIVSLLNCTVALRSGPMETYIVLYKSSATPSDAGSRIKKAGGTLVGSYSQIGVAIARSDNAAFKNSILSDARVEGACSTTPFGVNVVNQYRSLQALGVGSAPGRDLGPGESVSRLQWDMAQIHVREAHALTQGSRSVLVADIDSGIDFNHPSLAPNIDFANSCSCVSGVPDQNPEAWKDDFGHGTHTAGTIAAVDSGNGFVGIAPGVRLAAVKAATSSGFLFPEMVICAFIWAAEHGVDVANNSYFVDPWLFACREDPEQRAIWKALQRAILYAISKGVTVVAALGNFNQDIAHKNIDSISPDDVPEPLIREVNSACVMIPQEIPGVIGVSGNGNLGQKTFYSNYGVGVTQVVAPAGDSLFQVTADAPNGGVLSTFPSYIEPWWDPITDPNTGAVYCYAQGTSMACPHVTGVAALIISKYGKMSPGRVAAIITGTADPLDCPPNPFNPGFFEANCQGGSGANSFYGHGQVNAHSGLLRGP